MSRRKPKFQWRVADIIGESGAPIGEASSDALAKGDDAEATLARYVATFVAMLPSPYREG